MNWREFTDSTPDFARIGADLFKKTGLCLVGTIRRDGWPRISPCEVYIVDGELLLGMMWQSKKALDLLRDSRVTVHSTTCDREAPDGDFKVYGRVRDIGDPDLRKHYADAVYAEINWRPEEPYHLFAVDIDTTSFIKFGEGKKTLRWSARRGLERIRHPDE